MHNCSVSKYVATVLADRLSDDDGGDEGKRIGFRQLAGALKDAPLEELGEIPWELDAPRRFDLQRPPEFTEPFAASLNATAT